MPGGAAVAAMRWRLARDIVVIPKSVHKERMQENIDVFDFHLDEEDAAQIKALDTKKAPSTTKWTRKSRPSSPRIKFTTEPAGSSETIGGALLRHALGASYGRRPISQNAGRRRPSCRPRHSMKILLKRRQVAESTQKIKAYIVNEAAA